MRFDSPDNLIRVQESREIKVNKDLLKPYNSIDRCRGSITIDNERYNRYAGEVQITKNDFPTDERVNVIGKIDNRYIELLDSMEQGCKFKFVEI